LFEFYLNLFVFSSEEPLRTTNSTYLYNVIIRNEGYYTKEKLLILELEIVNQQK
jgi:hypothetical protein